MLMLHILPVIELKFDSVKNLPTSSAPTKKLKLKVLKKSCY